MSIYGSGLVHFDATEHAFDSEDSAWRGKRCAQWQRCNSTDAWDLAAGKRHYRRGREIACTCRCGPIVYQGSHVLPSNEDPRGGFVSVCSIGGFIDRSPERPPLSDDTFPYWPWLRLTVGDRDSDVDPVTLVLDRGQAEQWRDALTFWLDRCAPLGEVPA